MAFWEKRAAQGRGPAAGTAKARKHHLERDLLRLTLGAIEIASTRREVLEATARDRIAQLPHGLDSHRRGVFETTVVYELSQLTREFFAATRRTPVWERPVAIATPEPANRNGYSTNVKHVDIAAIDPDGSEVRVEYGIHRTVDGDAITRVATTASDKLESDSQKLWMLRNSFVTRRDEAIAIARQPPPALPQPSLTANYIVLWHELRAGGAERGAKLTNGTFATWHASAQFWAAHATTELRRTSGDPAATVRTEALAGTHLLTPVRGTHRAAVAAIFSVSG